MSEEDLSPAAARAALQKYHDDLNRAKFKVETERDRTLVLITGGALTVSFAYVPTLLDKGGPVLAVGALIAAWSLWVLTLVLTVANYSFSVWMYSAVLNALSSGDYHRVSRGHWAQKWVEPLNIAGVALMVAGFCAFGRFAIVNLERGTYVEEKSQEVSREEAPNRAITPSPTGRPPALAGQKAHDVQEEKVTPADVAARNKQAHK